MSLLNLLTSELLEDVLSLGHELVSSDTVLGRYGVEKVIDEETMAEVAQPRTVRGGGNNVLNSDVLEVGEIVEGMRGDEGSAFI